MEPPDASANLDRLIKEETLRRTTAEADKLAAERDEARARLATPKFLQPSYLTIMVALFSALLAAGNFFYTTRKVATLEQVDERFKKEQEASLARLGRLLNNRDERVVASAAIQLAIIYEKASIPIFEENLKKALADDNRLLATSALRGLAFLTDDAAKADASLVVSKVLDLPRPFTSPEDNQALRQVMLETLATLGTPRARERILEVVQAHVPISEGVIVWNDPELDITNWGKLSAVSDTFSALGILLRDHPDGPTLEELRKILHAKSPANETPGEGRATLVTRLMALDTLAKLRELKLVEEMLSDSELPMRLRATEWSSWLTKGTGLPSRIRQDIIDHIPSSAWLPPMVPGRITIGIAEVLYRPPVFELRSVMPEYDAFFQEFRSADPFRRRYLALAMAKDRQFICNFKSVYSEIASACSQVDSTRGTSNPRVQRLTPHADAPQR